MGVAFIVDEEVFEIGEASFLNSFFCTIAYHLESSNFGSKYPLIMKDLYWGKINHSSINGAKNELLDIQEKLKQFTPDKVIWDIDDLSVRPPWGDDIADDIKNLSEYYVTSEGEDLIEMMLEMFDYAQDQNLDITIE